MSVVINRITMQTSKNIKDLDSFCGLVISFPYPYYTYCMFRSNSHTS